MQRRAQGTRDEVPRTPDRRPAAAGLLGLQQAAGNRAVTRLALQRSPASDQATSTGTAQAQQDVADTLTRNGQTVRGWFDGIDESATFLGTPITASTGSVAGVHRRFLPSLRAAETDLQRRHPNKTLPEIGAAVGLHSVSGLRIPLAASGAARTPSLHSFGLAIDVNYAGSPFVGLQKPNQRSFDRADTAGKQKMTAARTPRLIERAMWLLRGDRFDPEAPVAGDVTVQWQRHDLASRTFKEYLLLHDQTGSTRFADLVRACGDPGRVSWNQPATRGWWNDLTWWTSRLDQDWALRDTYDFAEHAGQAERTGYMDLTQDLTEALVTGGGLLWGGSYQGAKDMMHFDRQGIINR